MSIINERNLIQEAREMAMTAKGQADLALSKIEGHELVCTVMYGDIKNTLDRVNGRLWTLVVTVAGSTIAGLAGLIVILLTSSGKI